MQIINYIRSYHQFPNVIPVWKVSSLRVTHPSALARLCKHRFAKDLHVLSILSAFILSQDQTLHSIYLYILYYFTILYLFSSLLLLLMFSLSSTTALPQLTKIILPNLTPFVKWFFLFFWKKFAIFSSHLHKVFIFNIFSLLIFFYYFFYIRRKIIRSFNYFSVFSVNRITIFI